MKSRASPFSHSCGWAGYLLGFSMGGFFDGILLHQILQWHHLLSALESDPFRDLRTQVLADGIFHALMYIILAVGLGKLWQTRKEFDEPGADRFLFANFLIGFGIWHIVDGIASHWLLGIHRIHPQSDNPLFWDMLFFGGGILCVILGFFMRRGGGRMKPVQRARIALLAFMVMTAATFAAVPWNNTQAVTVVFKPGVTAHEVFAAAGAVNARLMWNNTAGDIWMFHVPDNREAWRLYRHGAWFVGGSFFGLGCFTAKEPDVA